jgi:serine/threonine protein kinase
LKPDNILRNCKDVVKIVDFGVSQMFDKGNDKLAGTAGSPAFMAPELCKGKYHK